jgi:hypothetical protein
MIIKEEVEDEEVDIAIFEVKCNNEWIGAKLTTKSGELFSVSYLKNKREIQECVIAEEEGNKTFETACAGMKGYSGSGYYNYKGE